MAAREQAEKLKAEGNALFVQQKWSQAAAKYSEALKAGGPNAILLSNRAACRLNLKEFIPALDDAREATLLDPNYAKAHARMAMAQDGLLAYWQSVPKWLEAIKALPSENLSPSELKQKEQYEAGYRKALTLKKMVEKTAASNFPGIHVNAQDRIRMPWVEAQALVPQLQDKRQFHSSAFVLGGAYSEWLRGTEGMQGTKRVGEAMVGQKGAIEALTNAILMDDRVFHISDANFTRQYNDQIILEAASSQAWIEGGVETVMKAATERLATRGWDDVRPALAVTIRGWIMRGFMESALRQNEVAFAQFLGQATEIIEKGREKWGDLPREVRGSVFEPTFLRGVLNLELSAIQKRYIKGNYVKNREKDLEHFHEKANKLIEMVKAAEPAPPLEQHDDPGFVLAHWNYVKSSAFAMKGLYYREKARSEKNTEEKEKLYQYSVFAYQEAAAALPEDDENHCWFLSCALSNLTHAPPAPVGLYLDLATGVKTSRPKMMKIWAKSSMSMGGRDTMIDQSLGGNEHDIEAELLGAIERGEATRETATKMGFK